MSALFPLALSLENCLQIRSGNFLGGPLVISWSFRLKGPGFNPWSGNWDSTGCTVWPKKKRCCCHLRFFWVHGFVMGRGTSSRAWEWALVQHLEMNCLRSHTCWESKRVYWEGTPGRRAGGWGNPGGLPRHVARSLGFYGDGVRFWDFFGQTFWLGSDLSSIGVFLLTNLFHLGKIKVYLISIC